MTVATSNSRDAYNCSGGTTYDFHFGVGATSEVKVVLTDESSVETILTETTHYTISATNSDFSSGGTVTTVSAYAAPNKITIVSNVPLTQESDFTEGMATLYETFESGLDKLTRIVQQHNEIIVRSLTLPLSSASISALLPVPVANAYLAINSAGTAFEMRSLVAQGSISDEAYDAATWLSATTVAPSKKAVRDVIETKTAKATAAEITTGTEPAKAIAPDQLALTKYNGDWSFWGIKNLRLIDVHAGDATRVIVNPSAYNIPLLIGEHWHVMTAAVDVDSVDDLDTGALAAGTDYYVYACTDGTTLSFKVSANATNPTGFDAAHSRKIGGFHTLCVAVGAIAGHPLTGYAQKDILPASIWDLKHRAKNLVNVGMVYDSAIQKWVDIYLASGTGANTTSVNGGTISDTRNWMDFVDDGLAVGKRLLTDTEFTSIATGSNEETNITGSADPGTTSGHVDTAGRRMISNIGCEDCCGVVWQWLQDQSYYYYSTSPYWGNLPGGKGSSYGQFAADPGASEVDNSDSGGDVKLIAGGTWSNAADAGSRSRGTRNARWNTGSDVGAHFAVEPL